MRHAYWILIAVVAFGALSASAAQVDSPAPPTSPLSAMFSLEDIYNRLNAGTPGALRTGGFTNPTTGPLDVGHTFNDIMTKAPASDNANGATAAQVLSGKTYWSLQSGAWGTGAGTMPNNGAVNLTPGTASQIIALGFHSGAGTVSGDANLLSANIKAGISIFGVTGSVSGTGLIATGNATANDVSIGKTFSNATTVGVTGTRPTAPVARSGQTATYAAGDDGANPKGVTNPSPRFTDNSNGTVTDNLTGLIWLKNANVPAATRTWANAFVDITSLNNTGTMNGNSAGDTSLGGTHQTDWRLPNLKELQSLIDYQNSSPALPTGHPFTGIQSNGYWSSSTYAPSTTYAWYAFLLDGSWNNNGKTANEYVWAVRGGQ